MKMILYYTLKNPNYPKMYMKRFKNKKELDFWLSENSNDIYWKQSVQENAKSLMQKVVLEPSVFKEKKEIDGFISSYSETGFECLAIVFDNGNCNSVSCLHFIGNGDILLIDNVYYFVYNDSKFAEKDGFRLSIYPAGFTRSELQELFEKRKKVSLIKKGDYVFNENNC